MKTKDKIIEVARGMIAEVGFHATTTAQLAKKAGISEGTIYRHFQSKDDILVTILDDLNQRYTEFTKELVADDHGGPGTLENVLESHYKFVADNLDGIKIVISSFALLPPSRQSMSSVIVSMRRFTAKTLRKSMEMGIIRKVNPKATAMVLVALLLGLIELKVYWPETEDVSAEAAEFCKRALVNLR